MAAVWRQNFLSFCANQGVEVREGTIPRPSGRNYYLHLKAASQEKMGEKVCLMFGHGGGNDHLYPQVSLFKHLLQAGVDIFSFDVDGHGSTSSAVLDPEQVFSVWRSAMDVLQEKFAPPVVFASGFSLGASLLLHQCSQEQLPLRGAICMALPVGLDTPVPVLKEVFGVFHPDFTRQFAHYGWWGILPALGPFRRSDYPIRLSDRNSGKNYVGVIRHILEQPHNPENLQKIKIPLLFLTGENDLMAPAQRVKGLLPFLPQSELKILPRQSHLVSLFCSDLEREVLSFIQRHAAP